MDFIEPHDGAVLICSPMTRRVNLWPFGVGHFPKLNVHPNNSLIRGDGGQRIDHFRYWFFIFKYQNLSDRWNHNFVMRRGGEALAQKLNVQITHHNIMSH